MQSAPCARTFTRCSRGSTYGAAIGAELTSPRFWACGAPEPRSRNETTSAVSDPRYPRDLIGYGRTPPLADWPGGARVAVQFVLNYEEGAESSVLHGDRESERFLSDIVGAEAYPARHMSMESLYEYGSRVGVWRLLREFEQRALPLTVFGVAMALERHQDLTLALVQLGHEIAAHGWRWIHYQNVDETTEAEHVRLCVQAIRRLTGSAPLGWYTGRDSPNTRRLIVEHGGFLYDSDYYGDDLPLWTMVRKNGAVVPHLVIPYALDTNDMRFATAQGFSTAEHFYGYLRDAFDVLYAEGEQAPRMMSVGMHCRLLGRPGRFRALQRFLDHIEAHDRVWVCRRIDIARHWIARHPPLGGYKPSHMPRALFVELYGDVFEHTPKIAEATHALPLTSEHDTAKGLAKAMSGVMRALPHDEKLALIAAHPDLAGRLALAGELTAESAKEQSSAGLDRLSQHELAALTRMNDAYKARFHFPFIMAVKGRSKDEVIAAMRLRLGADADAEFDAALTEIERIALLRLKDRLP